MSPESLTTKAISTTAIQTSKIVANIDAYFMNLYIPIYSFNNIISNNTKNVHLLTSNKNLTTEQWKNCLDKKNDCLLELFEWICANQGENTNLLKNLHTEESSSGQIEGG
jgi:hypothetical protein